MQRLRQRRLYKLVGQLVLDADAAAMSERYIADEVRQSVKPSKCLPTHDQ